MCLAMYRPKGVTVPVTAYEAAFDINDDGGGFAYVAADKKTGKKSIYVKKGFMKWKEMKEALKDHEGQEMLIHFRRASVGDVNKDNCHPFIFSSSTYPDCSFAIIHNGTITYPPAKDKSDTRSFVDDVLAPLLARDPWFFDQEPGPWMMERILGANNKLAIMRYDASDDTTKVVILNKDKGHDAHGCWMSNYSYVPKTPYTPPAGSYVGPYHGGTPGMYGSDFYGEGNEKPLPFDQKYDLRGWELNPTTHKWEKTTTPDPVTKEDEKAASESPEETEDEPMSMVERIISYALEDEQTEPDAVPAVPGSGATVVKNEDKVVQFPSAKKEVVVPRDPGVTSTPVGMGHLSRKNQGRLKELAREYCQMADAPKHDAMTPMQRIHWMRADLMCSLTICRTMTPIDVDKWLIDKANRMEAADRELILQARIAEKKAQLTH